MPIANCFCFGSNTPALTRNCPCQGIDLRTAEQIAFEDRVRADFDAAVAAANGDEERVMHALYDADSALEKHYGWNASPDSPSRIRLDADGHPATTIPTTT